METDVMLTPDMVVVTTGNTGEAVFLGAFMGIIAILALVAVIWNILAIIGMWKTLVKIGRPGWIALIPFWRTYELSKASMGDDRLTVALVACEVLTSIAAGTTASSNGLTGLFGAVSIAALVLSVVMSVRLAHAFGKSTAFGVGLALLAPVFYLILGFGSAEYSGPESITFEFDKARRGTPRNDA